MTQEAFASRLRRHRQRAGLSLDELASTTRIKRELLDAFENNDLSAWPRGVYARAWVRAYASVVGLDPIDTVDEFCRLFPNGDRRVSGVIQEMAAIVAHPSEYRDELTQGVERRRVAPRMNVLPKPAWHVAWMRATVAFWMRLATPFRASQAPRVKRTPRTSS